MGLFPPRGRRPQSHPEIRDHNKTVAGGLHSPRDSFVGRVVARRLGKYHLKRAKTVARVDSRNFEYNQNTLSL